MSEADTRLAAALAAEHAAIYGYGMVGARLARAQQEVARQAEQAHRTRRDDLLTRLAAHGTRPPAAQPAYALPFAVSDQTGALQLAVYLEERTAAVWRHALGGTDGELRRLALAALIDTAVWATRWRMTAGITPATVALPGS